MKIDSIDHTDDQNVVIYIGQSIFEAEIEREIEHIDEPTSFNGLNDETTHERVETIHLRPYNLMRVEGGCNLTDDEVLEELEIKLNR